MCLPSAIGGAISSGIEECIEPISGSTLHGGLEQFKEIVEKGARIPHSVIEQINSKPKPSRKKKS